MPCHGRGGRFDVVEEDPAEAEQVALLGRAVPDREAVERAHDEWQLREPHDELLLPVLVRSSFGVPPRFGHSHGS